MNFLALCLHLIVVEILEEFRSFAVNKTRLNVYSKKKKQKAEVCSSLQRCIVSYKVIVNTPIFAKSHK